MTKKQKQILWIGTGVAVSLLLSLIVVFLLVPAVLRMRFRLAYREQIETYSQTYALDPYLVCAVIFCESGFDPNAKSGAGACGLMQVMPATGEEIAAALDVPFDDRTLFDPTLSIRFGTYYLRQQMDRFDNNSAVVLAAYNAGPNRAEQWLTQYGLDSSGGICYIPYGETDRYVDKVLTMRKVYRILYPNEFSTEKEGN